MKKASLFAKLGLPVQTETIYKTLLKDGPTTLAGLAKATGLYRPLLYRQLPLLLEKNLISESKLGKRTIYTAENPSNLQAALEDLQAEFQERLPVLQHQFEHAGKKPIIRYFQGRDGIAYVFDYMVSHTKKAKHSTATSLPPTTPNTKSITQSPTGAAPPAPPGTCKSLLLLTKQLRKDVGIE